MTTERKPVAFGDMRDWMKALKAAGELREIDAEVDWNIELGTITRLAQGPGTGPALLFNNIKDYNKNDQPLPAHLRLGGLNSYRRIAMMLGLPPDTHPRELVKIGRTILDRQHSAADRQATGPCKENIVTGKDIDLYDFPVAAMEPARRRPLSPHLRRRASPRIPTTGVMNVGIYRGMVVGQGPHPDPDVARAAYRPPRHRLAERRRRRRCRSPSRSAGSRRSASRGGSPVPKGVCEYDVMGAIRGAPVDLVKCETVDLYVPATAEIVIEGYLGLDPKTYEMEGPFAEFTGYVAGDRSPKPTIRVTAITHRNDPILRGTIEGSHARQLFGERRCARRSCAPSTAWNVLDRAGVPGITDVWCPPVQAGINLLIRMKQTYRGQAKQAANAIWGSSAAHVRYKHITVVDDDIDIHDYAAVDWAIAYRVNAGEDDIVIMPATFGAGLDPSTRKRDRNPALFGTGKWNRVLIDATINLDYDPDPELGGARFPPTVWPEQKDVDATMARWTEFGLEPNGG